MCKSASTVMSWERRLAPFVACMAALLLTACFKMDMTIHVDDDGSGSIEAIAAMDPSAIGALDEWWDDSNSDDGSPVDRDEMCRDQQSEFSTDIGVGASVEPYDDGTFCGVRMTIPFDSPADIEGALTDALGADDQPLTADPGSVTLEHNGDGWSFELIAGADEAIDDEEIPALFSNLLLGGADVNYRVDLPGSPVEHNATSVDGTTYTWAVDIANPPERMYVTTGAAAANGSGWWKIALVVPAIAAFGAAAYWLGRRNGEPTDTTPPSGPDPRADLFDVNDPPSS